MGYEIINNIDKGYFSLIRAYRGNNPKYPINYYLNKFNIDLNDYWIVKRTSNFRFLDIKDIEKYAGFTCFRKDTFNKEDIDKWLDLIYNELNISIPFLTKPFPPVEIYNKINIVE